MKTGIEIKTEMEIEIQMHLETQAEVETGTEAKTEMETETEAEPYASTRANTHTCYLQPAWPTASHNATRCNTQQRTRHEPAPGQTHASNLCAKTLYRKANDCASVAVTHCNAHCNTLQFTATHK